MATTNMLQWNPTAVNQETDAEYLADSQRAGGATDPSVFEADLANKLFYQLSTYWTAFAQALANKGYNTSDSNLNTLTSVFANVLTTADMRGSLTVVPYAPSVTLNASVSNGFLISNIAGSLAIAAINGLSAGQLVALYLQQNGAGGHPVTYPGNVTGGVQPNPAPGSLSLQLFGYDGSNLRAIGPSMSSGNLYLNGSAQIYTMEVGSPTAVGNPFIDFHSAGTNNDYDSRIIANGGGAGAGGGGLSVLASTVTLPATNTGALTATSLTAASVNANSVELGAPAVAGTPTLDFHSAGTSDDYDVRLIANGGGGGNGNGGLSILANLVTLPATNTGALTAGSITLSSGAPAGEALIGNGTSFVAQPLPSAPILSVVRNDVTGARAFGTTYTNTSGGQMVVTGSGNTAGSGVGSVQCLVDGDEAFAMTAGATAANGAIGFNFTVPPGSTYEVLANTVGSGANNVNGLRKWVETITTLS